MVDKNGSNISINDVVVYVDGIGTDYIGIVIDFVNDKLIKIKTYNYTIIVKATDTYLADNYNPYIETVDLTKLSWGNTHNGCASYGCYYKATVIKNDIKYYYKCSNFFKGQGVFGDESIYEVINSRFLAILGFKALKYDLVKALVTLDSKEYETYVCKSKNFFNNYDSRLTLEDLCDIETELSPIDVAKRENIYRDIEIMIASDFMIIQRDRHGVNIELLCKDNKYELSPLFDNGLSLLATYPSSLQTTDISKFDAFIDNPVNNYIGSISLFDNLDLIKTPIKVNRLLRQHKNIIFFGLKECLLNEYIEKIWQILTYRYKYLEMKGYIYHD